MLYINIAQDDELQECLNKVIAGIIPGENYDSCYYSDILENIFKYIHLEEFSGEYYCLLAIAEKVRAISNRIKSYKPKLTRESVLERMKTNISSLVRAKEVRIEEMLIDNGLDINLSLPQNLEAACSLLVSKTLELYDACAEYNYSGDDAISFLPAYEEAFLAHINDQTIKIRAEISYNEVMIGKKVYSGSKDSIAYEKLVQSEIENRLGNDMDENATYVDSIDKADTLNNAFVQEYKKLADFGLPPIDDKTPMCPHMLVVTCANEGVGKTQTMVHKITNLLLQGKSVTIMCGESNKGKVQAMIVSSYIYKKYGYYITLADIKDPSRLSDDMLKLLRKCQIELADGRYTLVRTFTYTNIYNELVAEYDKHPFDALFIDHSYALKGTGNIYDNLNAMIVQLREFKLDYPVYVDVNSHLSTVAKDLVSRGKTVDQSPTKGSSNVSAEADLILILIKNDILDKQGLLAIANYKRRDAEVIVDSMIVRKKFNVSTIEWDDKIQNYATGYNATAESLLSDIEEQYGSDSDDDEYEDSDYFDEQDEDYDE